ncbi:hypothetical protein PG988_013732 [Apiospora saccharicola]
MPEPDPSTALRKMSPGDWDDYRDLISRWYIAENKTARVIIKELEGSPHGFSVSRYELTDRFATWGLRKNLARREQECLVAQRKRKLREGEGSTQEYEFAGQCLSEERMKRLEYRLDHPIMAWERHTRGPLVSDPNRSLDALDQSPMPPSVDLVVSQPSLITLQSNHMYEWKPWKETPHQLPWISFSRNTALLNDISHALFGGSSRRFVASSDSKYILQFSSGQLSFGSSSIDQLSDQLSITFSRLMPESREGENMDRARSLVKTRGELDMEMLKVVLFRLSNNFIGEDDYKHIVRLAEKFGLGNPSIIRALFGVATKDLTIAAILDKLFTAACETSSLELVKVLVQENKEVKNGQLVRVLDFDMMPALIISVNKTDIGVLKAIMNVSIPLVFGLEPLTASIPPGHEEIAMRTFEQMATTVGGAESVPFDVLISAAYLGYTSILKKLADGPRDLNRTNGRGMSPLIAAVLGGSVVACSCLLELGADPNFTYSNPPNSISGLSQIDSALGRFPTALHHAIFLGHRQIVDILIKFKADINQLCDHTTLHRSWNLRRCWWCCSLTVQSHVPGLICSMENRAINALNIATKRGCLDRGQRWGTYENDHGFDYLEVSRLLLKHGAHAGYLELHHAIEFGDNCLVEDILSKSDSMGQLDASLNTMTPFQVALNTRNGPICETLLSAGFRVDAKLEDLSLAVEGQSAQVLRYLLRALKATYIPCTSELTKALRIALQSGFSDGVDILIDEGVQLPSSWWRYAFATYQADTVLSILERMEVTQDMMAQRPQDGYSGLEAAMLSPYMGVADIALDRFPRAYDSGAMLARLCKVLSADSIPDAQFDELLKRRQTVHEKNFTPALENAAIALAAYFQKSDLLSALLEKPQPQALALIPGPGLWDSDYSSEDDHDMADDHVSWPGELSCICPDCSCNIACKNSPLSRKRLGDRRWWQSRHGPRETSPIFMAAKGHNTDAIDQLILKGYESDLWTIIAAVHWQRPTLIIQKLLKTWRNHKLEFRIWESCPRCVRFIIKEGHLENIKLLTNPEANVGNLYYDTTSSSIFHRKWFDGPKTALQLATYINQASDDTAYYLIEKGADVTAPAHFDSGLTALQAAAMQGKITLARYLINKGAHINEHRAPRLGRTSLEAAAEAGRLDMVQFLLNEGTETEGKGRVQYLRAIILARSHGHAAVERLLRGHRDREMEDAILEAQDITPSTYYYDHGECPRLYEDVRICQGRGFPRTFLHPDEASFEERRDIRRWCIGNGMGPPLDAELELLSNEELELPLPERVNLLAIIMGNKRERRRRMNQSLGYESYGHSKEYLVATEVEIIRRNMPPTTPLDDYPSSSYEYDTVESSIPWSDEDMADDSPMKRPFERIPFHPEFNNRRDTVDFHETMHEFPI